MFQNQTATDVVKKVVGEQGLAFEGDSSGDPHDFIQQDNETDWDFIWRLAERCGFEFVVEDQKAYFRKPGRAGAVELEWPKTLSSFRPRMTAVQQVGTVSVFAHDPMTKSAIEAQATAPEQIAQIGIDRQSVADAFPEAEVHVATEPVKSMAEGTALAQALLDKLANGYISAEGTGPGNPRIKSGVMVDVKGVGSSFSGSYRVATSTHLLRGGGAYVTSVRQRAEPHDPRRDRQRRAARARLQRAARARHRHQQQRPRGPRPRPRAVPGARAPRPRARGRGSRRRARARSAGC